MNQLSLFTETRMDNVASYAPAKFDGETVEAVDVARLTGQLERVAAVMGDGQWRTLNEIIKAISERFGVIDTDRGVSSRLRDLRKKQFGSHRVESEPIGRGVWRYRIEPRCGK